jgi:hypothetical protein
MVSSVAAMLFECHAEALTGVEQKVHGWDGVGFIIDSMRLIARDSVYLFSVLFFTLCHSNTKQ